MIRAIMEGYSTNDMHNLYFSKGKSIKTVFFVILVAVASTVILQFLLNDVAVRYISNVAIYIFCITAVFSKNNKLISLNEYKLKKYPYYFKNGVIFFSFSDTYFIFSSFTKTIMQNQDEVEKAFLDMESNHENDCVKYENIKKVIEDRTKFCLFMKKGFDLIVNKNAFADDDALKLRELLQFNLKDNYIDNVKSLEDTW